MSLNRYATARDGNEPVIIEALRVHGITVYQVDKPLDLICSYGGFTCLAEVKMPRNKNNNPKPFTDAQVKFLSSWNGLTFLLVTVDDAIKMANKIKQISRKI